MVYNTTKFKNFLSLLVLASFLLLQSCRKNDFEPAPQPPATNTPAKVAVDWMEQTRTMVKSEGKNPPQASRIYAYAAIAVYESVVPGMEGYQSLANQIPLLTGLPDARAFGTLDYPTAVNEAMYHLSVGLVSNLKQSNISAAEALRNKYYAELAGNVPAQVSQNSRQFGKAVAMAILNRANNDNFSATRSMTYSVPDWTTNAAYWAPTDATNLTPLEPYWGKVKCFAMTSSSECEISSSIPFSTAAGSAFYKQGAEVFAVSQNLTSDEKAIASWWADGGGTSTPPGHWVSIQNQLVTKMNLPLAKAAEMYVLVNMGMADAFISCWDAKFKFNLVRPQSYIRAHIPGGSAWKPYIGTPPFPEYPSGHSVASGVAAQLLTQLLGNVAFTDATNTNMGLAPRSYRSFTEAAQEAAISRLYGGIHYREACDNGIEQGKLVAKSVMEHIKLKK